MDEWLDRYLEHRAYDDPSTYNEYKKQITKKGVKIFKSDGYSDINKLEDLVGDDKIEEAKKELQVMLEKTVARHEKKLGRKINFTEKESLNGR